MATQSAPIPTTTTNASSDIQEAVQKLVSLNINFLALDWDQTFLDIHTGGVWQGTLSELTPHVRPEFKELVLTAHQHRIRCAIVTFSRQPKLIKHVLEVELGKELAALIPVRGNDRSWNYEGAGSQEGKQPHMASAVEELLEDSGGNTIEITRATTLLIDDDKRNVHIALQDGVRAVWFKPEKPHHLVRDIHKLR